MVSIFLYLTSLIIAPQLWFEPMLGLRVDFITYPLLFLAAYRNSGWRLWSLSAQDRFFLAMVMWMALAWLINGATDRGAEVLANYVKWFVLYKLVTAILVSIKDIRVVINMLIGFALLLSLEGIQHRFSSDQLGWAGQTLAWIDPDAMAAGEPGRTRWVNIFDGPGVFCVIYTIALPFVLQYLVTPSGLLLRILGAVMTGTLLAAIYFTGSRGGFLTTLAILGLFVAMRMNISLPKIVGAALLVAFLFAVAPSHLTTMNDQSKSASHRVEMWAEGVEMVEQNPVFGIGKGAFASYTGTLIAHNSAVEVMGELGVFGLMLWIGCFYAAFKNIACAVRLETSPIDRSNLVMLALSIIGYIVSSMFVTLEYETLYFLLALASASGNGLSVGVTLNRKDIMYIGMLALGWILIMKAFVILFFS